VSAFGGTDVPPAALVRFDDDAQDYPCDIEMRLPAHGLADWHATAYVGRETGRKGTVRLTTLLGVFEGEAIATHVEIDLLGQQALTRLVGAGLLRLIGPKP
jgi:hypothetical protein